MLPARPKSDSTVNLHPMSIAGIAVSRLVPLGVSYTIADSIADIFYLFWRSKREAAQANYGRVLGASSAEERARRLARSSFRQFGRYIAELLHVQGWGLEAVRRLVTIEGEENIEQAVAYGRGVLFVSGHMGSVEVASTLLLMHDYKVTSVTERLRPKFLMDWLLSSRSRLGVTLLPVEKSGYRLLRALRRGEMVALLVDVGVRRNGGVPVQFFGQRAYFPGGPARLARLSGAPILFGLALRRPNGRFTAYVSPPIFANREADAEEDVQSTTQRLAEIFESFVRRCPDQWYPFRQMWPED